VIGVPNTLTAQVKNFSGTDADWVRVCFGVYAFSNNSVLFYEIGCSEQDVVAGDEEDFTVVWTPGNEGMLPGLAGTGDIHACLKVTVDYPYDSNFANNTMQRNVTIAQASVARAPFRLENNSAEEALMELRVQQDGDWEIRIMENGELVEQPVWVMAPQDCARDLVIELEPPDDADPGDRVRAVIRALRNRKDDDGGVVVEAVVSRPP
jgi:hypothetical protein